MKLGCRNVTVATALAICLAASGCSKPPSPEKIKADLVGHRVGPASGGWRFDAPSEFKSFDIKSSTQTADVIEYTIAVQLAGAGQQATGSLKVVYRKTDAGWSFVSVAPDEALSQSLARLVNQSSGNEFVGDWVSTQYTQSFLVIRKVESYFLAKGCPGGNEFHTFQVFYRDGMLRDTPEGGGVFATKGPQMETILCNGELFSHSTLTPQQRQTWSMFESADTLEPVPHEIENLVLGFLNGIKMGRLEAASKAFFDWKDPRMPQVTPEKLRVWLRSNTALAGATTFRVFSARHSTGDYVVDVECIGGSGASGHVACLTFYNGPNNAWYIMSVKFNTMFPP